MEEEKNYILKHEDITRVIIGCAFEVHKYLKNGFQEIIYQNALQIEFEKKNLKFEREYEMSVIYKDIHVGVRRVDFFVENNVMAELKAYIELEDKHIAQARNYLETSNLDVGLLINFGATSLEFKRLFNLKRHKLDNKESVNSVKIPLNLGSLPY